MTAAGRHCEAGDGLARRPVRREVRRHGGPLEDIGSRDMGL
ncbi:hypothetical protein ACWD5Q_10560 [Streptomyces sp. NPDC002513]